MGVTAGDRRTGLGDALLGANDVDDALIARGKVKESDARFGAVLSKFLHHRISERIGEGFCALVCRDDVIDGCESAVGIEDLQSKVAHHAESLRAGHLMDEVRAD